MVRKNTQEVKDLIDQFFDEHYLDTQTPPGVANLSQETVVRLLTRLIVSVCGAWWSVKELTDYIKQRQEFKESTYGPSS